MSSSLSLDMSRSASKATIPNNVTNRNVHETDLYLKRYRSRVRGVSRRTTMYFTHIANDY